MTIIRSRTLACLCLILLTAASATARKHSTLSRRLKPTTEQVETADTASSDTLTPAQIRQVTLAGYDKPVNATRETFFVTNKSGLTITSITVTFTYTDSAGRLLHKATHTVDCHIPANETRSLSVPSWDRQHSFYYEKSTVPKRSSTPYKVSHALLRVTAMKP